MRQIVKILQTYFSSLSCRGAGSGRRAV